MELEEKRPRVEDAMTATRAAVEEGIVAGADSLFALHPSLENSNA